MRFISFLTSIFLLLGLSSFDLLQGQCSFSGPTAIKDLDTTAISILVTGTTTNDLSDPSQGVCIVSVEMTHQFIGDIVAELVSPAGQRVRLMGPSAQTSALTQFITWDVNFVQTAFPAAPDAGFSNVWHNVQTWLSGETYTGTYYPNVGRLENFDSGPVDGEWRLEFIDQSMFGTGELLNFEIQFCNSAGIECNPCEPGLHTLTGSPATYCQYEEALDLAVSPDFFGGAPDQSLYSYGYMLFESNQLVGTFSEADLTQADGGEFMLCGVSYQDISASALFGLPLGSTPLQLQNQFDADNICASLSSQCISLSILPAPELITVTREICPGESVEVEGITYDEAGSYTITSEINGCDSVSIVEIILRANPYPIFQGMAQLSCDNPTVQIAAFGVPPSESIKWSTTDGLIASLDTVATITVARPGTYTATIITDDCTYIDNFTVGAEPDYLFASLTADTLSCDIDTLLLDLQLGGSVDSVIWAGDNDFIPAGNSISVILGGVYTAEIYGSNGCNTTRVVEVIEDTGIANITAFGDDITCLVPERQLAVQVLAAESYQYRWDDGTSQVGSDSTLIVTSEGQYTCIVTAPNGCMDTVSLEVQDIRTEFDIQLEVDTITCDDRTARLSFTGTTIESNMQVTWSTPQDTLRGFTSIMSKFGGAHRLNITAPGGCVFDSIITVVTDTEPPVYGLSVPVFGCNQDSVQLQLTGLVGDELIIWENESFSSMEEDPWIQSVGAYFVSITGNNGCEALDTASVVADADVPAVGFIFEDLNCNNDSVVIRPTISANIEFIWTLPSGGTIMSDTLKVGEEGRYTVRYTDTANDCSGQSILNLEYDLVDTIAGLAVDTLACSKTAVTIMMEDPENLISFTWMELGGAVLTTTNPTPTISQAGIYVIDFELASGCIGSDTVEVIQLAEVPNLQVTTDTITCLEQEVTLYATVSSDQYSIAWRDPQNVVYAGDSITVSRAGNYRVIASGNGGCRDTVITTVVFDAAPTEVNFLIDGVITCTDAEVEISAFFDVPPVSSSWIGEGIVSSASSNAIVDTAGIFYLVTESANGCIGVDTAIVISEAMPPVYWEIEAILSCTASSVSMQVLPADPTNTIVWEDPSLIGFINEVNTAGRYPYTISNDADCIVMDTFIVQADTTVPAPFVIISNELNCLFSTSNLTVEVPEAGVTYSWNGPGITNIQANSLTAFQPGEYTLLASRDNGCSSMQEFELNANLQDPTIALEGDSITCSAGKAILRLTSDLEILVYSWTGPGMFSSSEAEPIIFQAGTYTVSVIADNGCVTTDSITILDVQDFPDVEIGDQYIPCNGDPLEISASILSEGAEIRWFGPGGLFLAEPVLTATVPGEYVALAVNAAGCVATDTFQLLDEPLPPTFDFVADSLFCDRLAVLTAVEVMDDAEVIWIDPNGSILMGAVVESATAGDHQLIVTGLNGCKDTVLVAVQDGRTTPTVAVALVGEFQCTTSVADLTSEGSSTGAIYSYLWSSSDGEIQTDVTAANVQIRGEGTYVLSIEDTRTGCVVSDTVVVVRAPQSFQDVVLDIQPPSCEGFANASIEILEFIGGLPPYYVTVNDNDYGTSTLISYLRAGTQNIYIEDSLGCNLQFDLLIEEGEYPTVDLPEDITINLGDTVFVDPVISPDLNGLTLVWNIPPPCENCTSFTLQPTDTYFLELTVSDTSGCSAIDDMLIKVNRSEIERFPNIFSPNGDGFNDYFYMPYERGVERIEQLKIYDWNGALMFENSNFDPGVEGSGWNGTFLGDPVLEAVYMYEAVITLFNGDVTTVVGDVTLIR